MSPKRQQQPNNIFAENNEVHTRLYVWNLRECFITWVYSYSIITDARERDDLKGSRGRASTMHLILRQTVNKLYNIPSHTYTQTQHKHSRFTRARTQQFDFAVNTQRLMFDFERN